MKATHATAAIGMALGLSGCIIDPTHVEDDFGNSVRQMVAAQIYDPEAATMPDPEPPLLVDGVAASQSVIGYREDAKREDRTASSTDRVRILSVDEN